MLILELLAALVFALVFSLFLTRLLGRSGPGPGAGFLFFFLILSMAIWAGGVWLQPFGPQLWGVTWLTFLLAGLVITVLIAAVMPINRRIDVPAEKIEGVEAPDKRRELPGSPVVQSLVFGLMFWLMIALLFGVVIVHYAMRV